MDEVTDERASQVNAVDARLVMKQGYPGTDKEFAAMTCENQAMLLVFDYVRTHLDLSDTDHTTFTLDKVYVVQFTYILGNWKALVSTTLPDGMYYEVTYDKRRGVAYLDPYKRFDHKEIAIPSRRR